MKKNKKIKDLIILIIILILLLATIITIFEVRENNNLNIVSSSPSDNFPSSNLKNVFLNLERGEEYKEEEILYACEYVNNRYDGSDFRTITLLRFLYSDNYELTETSRKNIEETLVNFKYWMSDGGDDSMCYWSENHQILFATSEYLSGQMFSDKIFSQTGLNGEQHKIRAEERILTWLEQRWLFGFSEWYSNQYYVEDLAALANLIDFSENEEIVEKSKIVMDLLIYDIASQSFYGNFTSTTTRAYEKNRKSGEGNALRGVVDFIWDYNLNEDKRLGLEMNFLSMKNYKIPKVLYLIGKDYSTVEIKSSSGIKLSEINELGFNQVNNSSVMMQWGMEAFTNHQVISNTINILDEYGLYANEFLKDFSQLNYTVLKKTGLIPLLMSVINPQTNGIAMQQGNNYTYKTKDFMLATVINYYPGDFGDQHHIQSATISNDICIYNTHPAVYENQAGLNGNSPTYWVGYGYLPDAVQYKNVAMSIYRLPKKAGFMQSNILDFTYSWFDTDKFDQWEINGNMAFAKKDSAYIALIAKNELELHDNNQLIQKGKDTYWITELASVESHENLDTFKKSILDNKVSWNDGTLIYDNGENELNLTFNKEYSVNGIAQDIDYDRFDSPYVKAKRGDKEIVFNYKDENLTLNFDNSIRESSNDIEVEYFLNRFN